MHIGETILGVPILHLPPPRRLDTLKFNSALDEERPDDLVHFFRYVAYAGDDFISLSALSQAVSCRFPYR